MKRRQKHRAARTVMRRTHVRTFKAADGGTMVIWYAYPVVR